MGFAAVLPAEPRRLQLRILTGVILAMVAVCTAWSVYQAARWAGVQSLRMASGSARRIESTRASALAGQQIAVDIGLFTNWVNAYVEENEELSQFYLDRFRDEFTTGLRGLGRHEATHQSRLTSLALRHAGVPTGGAGPGR